jgi:hypothetical protein
MALIDELMQQPAGPNAQQPVNPNMQQAAGLNTPQDFRGTIAPLAGEDPASIFFAELMAIADDHGLLDGAIETQSLEDQADLADPASADPLQFLSREELTKLVQLYLAIPEPQRSEIGNTFREQLPPHVSQRLEAIIRLVSGRDAQQEVAQ